MNEIRISDDFLLSEFESPDTKEVKIDEKLIKLVQAIRNEIGQPLTINSGYRTPGRNKEVGGAKNSRHLYGDAVDIRTWDTNYTPDEFAELVMKVADEIEIEKENLGIGYYNGRVHVDVRGLNGEVSPAIWDTR
jgi:uncharacterized protein YcbK (DUF882 family)